MHNNISEHTASTTVKKLYKHEINSIHWFIYLSVLNAIKML